MEKIIQCFYKSKSFLYLLSFYIQVLWSEERGQKLMHHWRINTPYLKVKPDMSSLW